MSVFSFLFEFGVVKSKKMITFHFCLSCNSPGIARLFAAPADRAPALEGRRGFVSVACDAVSRKVASGPEFQFFLLWSKTGVFAAFLRKGMVLPFRGDSGGFVRYGRNTAIWGDGGWR